MEAGAWSITSEGSYTGRRPPGGGSKAEKSSSLLPAEEREDEFLPRLKRYTCRNVNEFVGYEIRIQLNLRLLTMDIDCSLFALTPSRVLVELITRSHWTCTAMYLEIQIASIPVMITLRASKMGVTGNIPRRQAKP